MSRMVELLAPTVERGTWLRPQYLLDSMLAILSSMTITGIIFVFHLYPRIPNISIIYLLMVLSLASTRGRYAAILASLVAFLSFDFFIVPPLFTFTIYRVEEWIALFVFLVTAILTSQLAVSLRQRAEQANRRERETRVLYELLRTTNSEDGPEHQLRRIAQAIVDIFSSLGVYDCVVLQTDAAGTLHVQASAYHPVEEIQLSPDEQALATRAIEQSRSMESRDESPLPSTISARFMQRIIGHIVEGHKATSAIHFIPLRTGPRLVGVLRLSTHYPSPRFPQEGLSKEGRQFFNPNATFLRIFLEHVASLIEQVCLRRENMRIEILQRTDALRAALLASVSHDLRTPLTSIKAAASSLLQEDIAWDDEVRRSFALSIEHEVDRLTRLVSNLLDMSRIEEGVLKPEKDWYPLAELVRDVLHRMRPLLQGCIVHTDLPDDLAAVELDYVQMGQVLTNLIENAVRYTPPASPIDVSVQFEGAQALLRVADRGPGLSSSDLERVFDKFYRAMHGHSPQGQPAGSGLGLAICKGLVEAHGGRIWAESRPGGGTIFSVALPIGSTERILV